MAIELEALKKNARHFEIALETSNLEKTTLHVSVLFDNHFICLFYCPGRARYMGGGV